MTCGKKSYRSHKTWIIVHALMISGLIFGQQCSCSDYKIYFFLLSFSSSIDSFNVRSHTEKYHLKNYSIFIAIVCVYTQFSSLLTQLEFFFSFTRAPKKNSFVVGSSCLLFINKRRKWGGILWHINQHHCHLRRISI